MEQPVGMYQAPWVSALVTEVLDGDWRRYRKRCVSW